MNDPIVDEVRRYRDEHAKKFNYDLNAICADFRKKHTQYIECLKQLGKNSSGSDQVNQVAETSDNYSTD